MTILKNRNRKAHLYKDIEKIKADIIAAMHDTKSAANHAVVDSFENVKARSNEVKDKMADYTADNPFKSLTSTFLLGLIIGYLLHK